MVRSVLFSLPLSFGLHTQLDASVGRLASLQKMEKEWQTLASESGKPDTNYHRPNAAALQMVIDTMDTVLADVDANKVKSDEVLEIANQAIHAVNTAYGVSYDEDLKMYDGDLTYKAVAHSECRTSEDTICRGRDVQNGNTGECTNALHPKIPDCACEVDDQNALQVANYLATCMDKVNDWSGDQCTDGRSLQEHKTDLDQQKQACTDQTKECNEKQGEFEDAWCAYYTQVHTTCNAHKLNYGSKKDDFDNFVTAEDEKAAENKKVCQAAKKVKCYVDVLSTDYNSNDAQTVQHCQSADFDSDCADLTTLEKPPIPAIADCNFATLMDGVPGAEPGDSTYKIGNYNEDKDNRLTAALTVYSGSTPLSSINACSLLAESTPIYANSALQPNGNVQITYVNVQCVQCGMCEGNCDEDSQCGKTTSISDAGTSVDVQLVCVNPDGYGEDHPEAGPRGCDMTTMQAAASQRNAPLGVCALPGNYQ